MLVLTYAAYSALSVAHQSWGAMLGGDEALRSRIVSWREGLGLVGVLAGVRAACGGRPGGGRRGGFCVLLVRLAGLVAARARQRACRRDMPPTSGCRSRPAFRRLLGVFMLNGIASAVPATLVLFFIQDRLQAPAQLEPAVPGAAISCARRCPSRCGSRWWQRFGLARSWLAGMVLAMSVFVWATQLGAGDIAAFLVVCALSGVALGTDLALPGAMLAGVIANAGDRGQAEGAYFGWWNFATKLNLALAAGLALPLLGCSATHPARATRKRCRPWWWPIACCPALLKLGAALALYFTIRTDAGPPT
jgi:GPH family glycoside/pentoside/hexuronide:cation symporter